MQIVIEISEKDYKKIIKNDEDEQVQESCLCLLCRLSQAIKDGTPLPEHHGVKKNPNMIEIPENATNGDVIKAVFPNLEWAGMCEDVDFYFLDSETPYSAKLNTFRSWWNAPYKQKVRAGDEEIRG